MTFINGASVPFLVRVRGGLAHGPTVAAVMSATVIAYCDYILRDFARFAA